MQRGKLDMSTLSGFFKGSATHLGLFYPRDYLIAVFSGMETAVMAERRLLEFGFPSEDVAAAPGEEIVNLAGELANHHGLWVLAMQELSRVLRTEEVYTDQDLELASRGAAFLMVYCPTEGQKRKAWQLIEPVHPLMARHYTFGGIEHLVGET
jgi:hypothetical protein